MRLGHWVVKQGDGSCLASEPNTTASNLQTAQFEQQQKQLWEQFGGWIGAHDVNDLNICDGTFDAMRASLVTSAII